MIEYKFSKTVFDKGALLKTVYLFQENFNISILEDTCNYILHIDPKNDTVAFDYNLFNSKLQEQQLRETLNLQFGELRNAIYQKAFERFER